MIFLRFPDEPTFLSLAPQDEYGNITVPNIDVIGTIYEGGEYDDEGNVITPPVAIPGYHVNMIGDVPEAWQPYVIDRPENPYRVFAESPPAPPKPPRYPVFTALQMLDLFTESEQLAVVAATMSVPEVKLWYDRMIAASYVTYEDPRVEAGLAALVGAGLLDGGRKDAIVAAMQPVMS